MNVKAGDQVKHNLKRKLKKREIDSVALNRIIEEVKAGPKATTGYNRTYHRHNR